MAPRAAGRTSAEATMCAPSMQAPIRAARAAAVAAFFLSGACAEAPARRDTEPPPSAEVALVPRTPHMTDSPCGAQCHDAREPDPRPRELTLFHSGQRLDHGSANRWCDDCHAIDEPDRLVTLAGTRITYDESDAICGQCHGEKHRDWSRGLHGLATGGWTGTAHRRLCTACHEPHAPGRIELEALPPPEPDPRAHGGGE